LVAPELQNGGQKSQKNLKNLIQDHFSTPLKNNEFQDTFFAVFSMFWKPPNLENQAKTLYCMQKTWLGVFRKKNCIFQKLDQKRTTTRMLKPIKTHKKHFHGSLWKATRKMLLKT